MVLPLSMRLKGHKCFDYIHRKGLRFHGSLMTLKIAKAKPELLKLSNKVQKNKSLRCAIAISNKVSKRAVTRNHLRRKLQEHITQRFYKSENLSERWVLISLKPSTSKNLLQGLTDECDRLFYKAGLTL